ncbi:MAG: glutamate--cysteine ligase [Gammaproteobacteria bacterium]|nr:glutamate--cysteine ligase [Gammaproteobacteria bacterium]MBI5616427.1 glutamate--cysteine ligase [Gammaproteobacteria bacterium]
MMYAHAERMIAALDRAGARGLLHLGRKGLEKESLRIRRDGAIATSPHPEAWGSALTHPYLTTDYSEALAELITPALTETPDVCEFLHAIHQFLYAHLTEDELLWCASMPCAAQDDRAIPLAEYGSSNLGRMKHVYRVGLDYRYGRRMQAIAGVHFNYSLPLDFWPLYQALRADRRTQREFMDECYFALIRNFRRMGWLVPLLFGTSPALCSSFLAGRTTRFKPLDRCTHFLPYATSLRMSDIGYKNKNQAALKISYDSLAQYVASLGRAIRTPYPEYEAIGLFDGGQRIQLNSNVLQIENEFYSFVRPKRTIRSGEKPSVALRERGVEYVEMRALDVYPFEPTGVYDLQLRFLEAFLILCLLAESPPISPEEQAAIEYNELTVALRGREPGLELLVGGGRRAALDWARDIVDAVLPICDMLDAGRADAAYVSAQRLQSETLADPERLPSARLLAEMRASQMPFSEYMSALSRQHAGYFRTRPLDTARAAEFEKLAADSRAEQRAIEAADRLSFEEYLEAYFAERLPEASA